MFGELNATIIPSHSYNEFFFLFERVSDKFITDKSSNLEVDKYLTNDEKKLLGKLNKTSNKLSKKKNVKLFDKSLNTLLNEWAKTMANELGRYGITVNNILPGVVETRRLSYRIQEEIEKTGKTKEEVMQYLTSSIPVARFAQPEEIGWVIAFVASPLAAYINGINLPVDGGITKCL